jgi:uncharacterized membrane protein YdjX (TVP38/TMEM64 family)
MAMHRSQRRQILFNRSNGIALGILLLCLLLCLWLTQPDFNQFMVNLFTPDGFEQTVRRLGSWGALIYIGLITLSVVVSPIPSAPLAVIAGALWGTVLAGIYSVIGGFLGGLIAYYLGRTLGRSAIKALTGKIVVFSKRKGEIYLGWLIFGSRLLPVLSFDLISYGAGMTGLSLPIYATATLLGMIPSTFLLTYLGDAIVVDFPQGIVLSIMFLIILVGLPWGIRRYNWLGLRDTVRME